MKFGAFRYYDDDCDDIRILNEQEFEEKFGKREFEKGETFQICKRSRKWIIVPFETSFCFNMETCNCEIDMSLTRICENLIRIGDLTAADDYYETMDEYRYLVINKN